MAFRTTGYMVYNTYHEAGCTPYPADASFGRAAISNFDGNKSPAYVYRSRKAARRAVGRALRASGGFLQPQHFQVIRLVFLSKLYVGN